MVVKLLDNSWAFISFASQIVSLLPNDSAQKFEKQRISIKSVNLI